MAEAITIPAQHAPPPGGQWLDLHECARRMQLSSDAAVRHILRWRGWPADGLARIEKQPGKKPFWVVHETADPKLARVPSVETIAIEARAKLSDAQRKDVSDRERILREWEERRATGQKLGVSEMKVTASFLRKLLTDEGRTLSRRTLFNWAKRQRQAGVAVDGRWSKPAAGETPDADPFLDYVRQLYLNPKARRLTDCVMIAEAKADEQGWAMPGDTPAARYKACQRMRDAIPKQVIIRYRQGMKAFTDQCEPPIRRDYTSIDSNSIWCSDHHRFDVMIKESDGGEKHVRPWITAWEDMRSRKILGWCIFTHDPNTDTILRSFIQSARPNGLPAQAMIDNGKDYDSRALQGITKAQRRGGIAPPDETRIDGAFNILGVQVHHVWKYHGQSKPIERHFRTVCDGFARQCDTYCGGSTATKPEDLGRQIAAGKAPTLEEFTAQFARWVEDCYHNAPHSGDAMNGQTPAAVYEQCLVRKRSVAEEILLFACLPRFGPVKVSKEGVVYRGLRFGAFDAQVQAHFGKRVMLAIDNDDLSAVTVLDLEGRPICRARSNIKLGFNADSQVLRDAIAEKKQLRRTMRTYVEQRPRMSDDIQQLAARGARKRHAQRQAANPTPPPDSAPSIMPVRTGLEDCFPAIQQAMRHKTQRGTNRVAVGAENLDLDKLRPRGPMLPQVEDEGVDVFAAVSAAMQRQRVTDRRGS